MKKKLVAILMCICMGAMAVAGCGSDDSEESDSSSSESGDEGSDADTVTIGAVLPLSGDNATTGENLKAAMEVAEDIINNSHDIDWDIAQEEGLSGLDGAKIEIDFADNQSDADLASTEAASLLDQDVAVITGAYSSAYSISVASMALEYYIPMICGSSSSASLTDGTYEFSEVFNRIAANDDMESEEFFEYLDYLNEEYDAGIETVGIAWINNAYGIHANEMFEKYAEEFGYEVVASESYEADITSADTEATKIVSADPDVVFHASYIKDLTLFAQAYDSMDFEPTAVICYCGGFQDASFGDVATELGVNFYAGGQACSVVLDEKLEVFGYINELYEEKTGQSIDGPALEEFASIIVAAQAINAAGTTDPETLIETLKTETFDAPYLTIGEITFDEDGQNTAMASFVTQLIDGKYEVVYPIDDYVTSDPEL